MFKFNLNDKNYNIHIHFIIEYYLLYISLWVLTKSNRVESFIK